MNGVMYDPEQILINLITDDLLYQYKSTQEHLGWDGYTEDVKYNKKLLKAIKRVLGHYGVDADRPAVELN